MLRKLFLTSLFIGILLTALSCQRHQKELFEVVLKYDTAVKNGDPYTVRKLISSASLLEIRKRYPNENAFIQDLVEEGSKIKDKPSPKLKNITRKSNTNYLVKATLFNGKDKTFHLVREGEEWKIDFIPILKKLDEANKQFSSTIR